ncbi:MAG: pyridoxal-phosphate dependent enzyme [Chloroflexota bacterium]
MIPYAWFEEAQKRIAPHIRVTPLEYDAARDIYLKWESQQVTGSFKVRGALNKVLALQEWERQCGLVAASAGNHGQGLALAGKLAGAAVTIFASEHAVPAKVAAMRSLGATVELVPGGYGEAEQAGLAFAAHTQATWVSPYNNGLVIAGQGTLGLETLRQLPALSASTWVVPVGGGGLIAGIAAALHSSEAAARIGQTRLVAVQSQASPFFHAIYHRGSQAGVDELPSLADGLAGPLEPDALTIPIIRRLVDDFILVSEAQIAEAIRFAWTQYQQRIEGSAAAALAAVLSGGVTSRPAVVIISGGNIQPEIHAQIVKTEERT